MSILCYISLNLFPLFLSFDTFYTVHKLQPFFLDKLYLISRSKLCTCTFVNVADAAGITVHSTLSLNVLIHTLGGVSE